MPMKKLGTEGSQSPRPADSAEPGQPPPARLRLGSALAFAGFAVSVVAGRFLAESASANGHPATCAEEAQ